jgi:Uma2 family endonuclease
VIAVSQKSRACGFSKPKSQETATTKPKIIKAMISTATIYTKAEYDKICEFAGSHFEYDDGFIVWKHNGQIIDDEILGKLLNQEDIDIYSQMGNIKQAYIISNIHSKLCRGLDEKLFHTFSSILSICIIISGKEKIRIPDVAVTPRKLVLTENQEVTNPVIIFEVVSPSSVQTDYVDKLREYKSLESLQEYIIVEQEKNYLVHYQRFSANEWTETKIETNNNFLYLPTVAIRLEMQEIYRGCENL